MRGKRAKELRRAARVVARENEAIDAAIPRWRTALSKLKTWARHPLSQRFFIPRHKGTFGYNKKFLKRWYRQDYAKP
jgi:hypothetical protein